MLWTKVKLAGAVVAAAMLCSGVGLVVGRAASGESPGTSEPEVSWGEPVSGLRAGIRVTQRGPVVTAEAVLKNDTDKVISVIPYGIETVGWSAKGADGFALSYQGWAPGLGKDGGNYAGLEARVSVQPGKTAVLARVDYLASRFGFKNGARYTLAYHYAFTRELWGTNREASAAMLAAGWARITNDGIWTGLLRARPVDIEIPEKPAGSTTQEKAGEMARAAAEHALSAQYAARRDYYDQSGPLPGKDGSWIRDSGVAPKITPQADGWTFAWSYAPRGGGVGFHAAVKVEPEGRAVLLSASLSTYVRPEPAPRPAPGPAPEQF